MRNEGAKKGGGLMILHHSDSIYDMKMEETIHQDMLTIRGQFKGLKASIILVYLSIIRGEEEKQNNQMIKKEIKKQILKRDDDEAVFLLGDFNGHTGTIGEQQQNYNGKLLMDLIIECNLTMLNDTDKCTGIDSIRQYLAPDSISTNLISLKYILTWSRGDQKSTINFVLVNNKGYQTCEWMKIDETQDVFDLSSHNLIDIELKLNTVHHRFGKKYKWIEKECYNFDARSTDLYIRKLEETLENGNVNTIEEFNMMIEDASNQTLKRSYKQRIIMNNDKIIAKEPSWTNAQIRSGIKKRKQLNREKRHCKDMDKKEAMEEYINQKKKVQTDIYDAISLYHELAILE